MAPTSASASSPSPIARRAVIFVGPHKTGSTSLEQFFQTHAGVDDYHVRGGDVAVGSDLISTAPAASSPDLLKARTGRSRVSNKSNQQHFATPTNKNGQQEESPYAESFENWTWPTIGARRDGNGLFEYEPNRQQKKKKNERSNKTSTLFVKYEDAIRRDIREAMRRTPNIILGTENFDRFSETGALDRIVSFLRDNHPTIQIEFLIHYRSPRIDHLVSWWKQQTRKGRLQQGQSFRQFWCKQRQVASSSRPQSQSQASTTTIAASPSPSTPNKNGTWQDKAAAYSNYKLANLDPFPIYLDPLFLAQRLLMHSSFGHTNDVNGNDDDDEHTQDGNIGSSSSNINSPKIWLVDMAGIAKQQSDISHTVACNVLNVPCTDHGWIRSNHQTTIDDENHGNADNYHHHKERKNVLSDANPNLSIDQRRQMESVLQQHDCIWHNAFRYTHASVHIVNEYSPWHHCNDTSNELNREELLLPPASVDSIHDKWNEMISQLRIIVGCNNHDERTEHANRRRAGKQQNIGPNTTWTYMATLLLPLIVIIVVPFFHRRRRRFQRRFCRCVRVQPQQRRNRRSLVS